MTDTLAPSAAPPYALRVWADNNSIYTEIPGKPGAAPYVIAFPLAEGGLSKALDLLRTKHTDFAGPAFYSRPAPSLSNKPAVGTAVQRAHAQAVLRKLKIVP